MATFFLITFGVIFAALLIGLPFILDWLADGNVLYTKVKEGTAKAVMNGKSLSHLVMSLKGHHLNDPNAPWYDEDFPDWEVLKNEQGQKYDNRFFLSRWLGLYFVGLPPFRSIYSYGFAWMEMNLNPENNQQEIRSRNEVTDFIFVVSFPYMSVVVEAETQDNLPVNVLMQIRIRVINPFKALFETENWMEVITGLANGTARNFIGSRKYAQLVSETHEPDGLLVGDPNDRCSTSIKALNDGCPDGSAGTRELYGIAIDGADIQRVDIAGSEASKILTATVERYTADQRAYTISTAGKAEADAILARGTAEANVITAKGTAEASAIEAKGVAEARILVARLAAWRDGGPLSAIIAQTEAMASEGPGKTVIWANNPLLRQADTGLGQAFDALGLRTPEDVLNYLKDSFGLTPKAKA